MPNMVNVGTMVTPEYRARFHKLCIDNGTTMSAVLKDAIKSYMELNPPKDTKFTGIT